MTVVFNHFNLFAEKLHEAEKQIVAETVQDIAKTYEDTAPRKSGFMASSVYVRTADTSTYGQGTGTPPKGASLLPEVDAPPDDTTAYAAVGASYAVYPELGTRFAPSQPAFFPAVEAERPVFAEKISRIEERL